MFIRGLACCGAADETVEQIHKRCGGKLPWTQIAALMNNERFPIDYLRRWPGIMGQKYLQKQRQFEQLETELPGSSKRGRFENTLLMLGALEIL